MDKQPFTSLFIVPIIIGIVIVSIEYLIVQPLGPIGLLIILISALLVVTVFEYYNNRIFPVLGWTDLRSTLEPLLSRESPIRGIIRGVWKALAIIIPTILSLSLFASSYIIDDILLTDSIQSKFFVRSGIFVYVSIILSSVLSGRRKVMYLLIIFISGMSILALYLPIWSIFGSSSTTTLTEMAFPMLSNRYLIEIQRLISIIISVILLCAWMITLSIPSRQTIVQTALEDPLMYDNLQALFEDEEILSKVERQNTKKLEEIHAGWSEFIEFPTDDYIYYIRHWIPVRVEGQTVIIGYVNQGEDLLIEDVRFALQQDMQAHYGWSNLKIGYIQISLEKRNRIRALVERRYEEGNEGLVS